MSILVVGGAGYIGAHVVRLLLEGGSEVVVIDDLSTSVASRIAGVPLFQFDVAEDGAQARIEEVIRTHQVEAVIHFAAKKQVGESVERPLFYYRQNIGGFVAMLSAMEATGVKKMIFSSSAAVYGEPEVAVVDEEARTAPISPYGKTKLIGEWIMADCARAWGLQWVALRYFNVAGAAWPELGDPAILNLIPMVLDKVALGQSPRLFGDDYDTPDGSCIRDYVHVRDLAYAHIVAMRALEGQLDHNIYNVGTGTGSSVKEVIDALAAASGIEMTPSIEPRRAGDPPKLIASPERIAQDMGFHAELTLTDICDSAWEAWQAGPRRIEV